MRLGELSYRRLTTVKPFQQLTIFLFGPRFAGVRGHARTTAVRP
jgi:hypothetical protein